MLVLFTTLLIISFIYNYTRATINNILALRTNDYLTENTSLHG